MPTNLTDSSTLTDPIQGPADADPQVAASYNLGFQGLANRTRWLADRLGSITGLNEWLYPTPKSRTVVFGPLDFVASRASAGADPNWFINESDPNRTLSEADVAAGRTQTDLRKKVPGGSTIIRMRALVTPASSYSGGDRMLLQLATSLPVFGDNVTSDHPAETVTTLGQSSATITVRHSIDSGVIAHVVNPLQFAFARIIAGNGTGDLLAGLQVTFTEPGPRGD
jgi:hypothetical protein